MRRERSQQQGQVDQALPQHCPVAIFYRYLFNVVIDGVDQFHDGAHRSIEVEPGADILSYFQDGAMGRQT